MTRPDLVVIEVLDATGAALSDACARRRALLDAGSTVQSIVLDPFHDEPAPAMPPGVEWVASVPALKARVRATLDRAPRAQVVLACASSLGFAMRACVPRGRLAGWWPTAVGTASAPWWQASAPALWPALAALDLGTAPLLRAHDATAFALAASTIEPLRHARGRLPLWDGEYLLVPGPLDPACGAALVHSFARVAQQHPGLDLVVLCAPPPRLTALAGTLGVGTRVHFAGPAASDAELAWCSSAEAVVVAPADPLAACSILRALACGAPLLIAREGPAWDTLRGWLTAAGAVSAAQCGPISSAALEHVLARGEAVERARDAGRALAARHTVEHLGRALRPALRSRLQDPPDSAARAA